MSDGLPDHNLVFFIDRADMADVVGDHVVTISAAGCESRDIDLAVDVGRQQTVWSTATSLRHC